MSTALRERVVAALSDAFELEREIGRGGMGVVYSATDRKLRRRVAIKVLPPELAYREDVRHRFLHEAQTAAQLSHPNIVPIYSVEERDGLVCFVMALVDGESLASRLARDRALPIDEVEQILIGVADALGYAHAHGIVHRDVKPDNILLDRATGCPLVTDFGIARAAEGDARLTVTGIVVGTPAYMSPEQAVGEKEIDGRSDLYSLAVVGYQMLAGELPFKAANTPSMLMKHISDTPRPIHQLRADAPTALVAQLDRALGKKPYDRPSSAWVFRDTLRAIQSGRAAASAAPPSAPAHGAASAVRPSAAWKHPVPPQARELRPRERAGADRPPKAAQRDAVEAANAAWDRRLPVPVDARERPIPPFMPPEWAEARRGWQRPRRAGLPAAVPEEPSLAVRARLFRRQLISTGVTIAGLSAINMVFSPGFFWAAFPAFFMSLGLLQRAAVLYSDGARWREIFGTAAREARRADFDRRAAEAHGTDTLANAAEPGVLNGPHGDAVRRAADDQRIIRHEVARLAKADRELIPDVLPTADALAERVVALCNSIHRLDEDVRPGVLDELDQRIEATRAQPESNARSRTLELLERQRTTVSELHQRRETLAAQRESASLLLQNMRLDLIALRSAGVNASLHDVNTATQEARALSRDIAHVLDAAREIR